MLCYMGHVLRRSLQRCLAGLMVFLSASSSTVPGVKISTIQPLEIGIAYGNTLMRMSDAELAAALDDAVVIGARRIRADLAWGDIQPLSPDQYNWKHFDHVVDAARRRGLTVLPVLAYTPPWARPSGCATDKCAPVHPALFARFAAAAASRYAPRGVHAWEVWNEPNTEGFWQPEPNARNYTQLLKGVSAAIRGADSSAFVILGGLAAVPTETGRISQTVFLSRVSQLGGNRVIDAVAYHPYTYPYLASESRQEASAWSRIDATSVSLRSVLGQYGTPNLPIWITEYGAPTNGPGQVSDGTSAPISPMTTHVTEGQQARIATDVVVTAASNHGLGALIWYADKDLSDDDFYGLRRGDGSAKPAFAAFRKAVAGLR
jgi:polysaccharide biosynthesis protein PslG